MRGESKPHMSRSLFYKDIYRNKYFIKEEKRKDEECRNISIVREICFFIIESL